jgi:hypothetical protein
MTTYPVSLQFDAPPPATPLRIVFVIPPTVETISDHWGEAGYPVVLQLSRELTYHEVAQITDDPAASGFWAGRGDHLVVLDTTIETVANTLDALRSRVTDLEKSASMRRQAEELTARNAEEVADHINSQLAQSQTPSGSS